MKLFLAVCIVAFGFAARAQTNVSVSSNAPALNTPTSSINAVVVSFDEPTRTLLKSGSEDKLIKKETLFSTLLGAALAIAGGIATALYQERREVRRKQREDSVFEKNVVLSIRRELEAMSRIYQAGIGQHVKDTQFGKIFPVRLALTQDWFTVFNANAVHLGRIDAEVARRIIAVYAMVKGLIEELRINNEGLTRLEEAEHENRVENTFKTPVSGNRPEEIRVRQIQAQLVKQLARIKTVEAELKVATDELFALLDQS